MVQRYGPQGSFWRLNPRLPVRPLLTVEIWNEPWFSHFWMPQPDASRYAELVRVAGAAIRQVAPSVTILVSGDLSPPTSGPTDSWLALLLAVRPSIAPFVDGWSIHPYPEPKNLSPEDGTGDESFQQVTLVERMVQHSAIQRPLWITEIGWSSANEAMEGVSEDAQAEYLQAALTEALQTWGSFVARTFVYEWGSDRGEVSDLEGHFALSDSAGRPKPALNVLRRLLAGSRGAARTDP